MTHRDGMHDDRMVLALAPVSEGGNTPLVSGIVNTQGFDALTFYIASGVLGDAGAQFVTLLEHGDDSGLSDAAAVDDIDMLPQGTGQEAAASFTEANDGILRRLGYIGNKQYVRLTITPANNATSALFCVIAELSYPWSQPT